MNFLRRNPWIFIVIFIAALITSAILPARFLTIKLAISCGMLVMLLFIFKMDKENS